MASSEHSEGSEIVAAEVHISAQLVKALREKTGAPLLECRSALAEARGDLAGAEVILRKRGISTAQRKAGRVAVEGLVGAVLRPDGSLGSLVEVNCESDFVARTDEFQALVERLAEQVASADPRDVPALLAQPYAGDRGRTVQEALYSKVANLGENIVLRRFARYGLAGPGWVGAYLHHGKIGVLVEVACSRPAGEKLPEGLRQAVHDVAMHVAASDPRYLRPEDVEEEVLRQEREIQRERARAEGKPEKILDKMVEGRLGKFYEETCLLEQPFIRDLNWSVKQWLASRAAEFGSLEVRRFTRFKVGEGVA